MPWLALLLFSDDEYTLLDQRPLETVLPTGAIQPDAERDPLRRRRGTPVLAGGGDAGPSRSSSSWPTSAR